MEEIPSEFAAMLAPGQVAQVLSVKRLVKTKVLDKNGQVVKLTMQLPADVSVGGPKQESSAAKVHSQGCQTEAVGDVFPPSAVSGTGKDARVGSASGSSPSRSQGNLHLSATLSPDVCLNTNGRISSPS